MISSIKITINLSKMEEDIAVFCISIKQLLYFRISRIRKKEQLSMTIGNKVKISSIFPALFISRNLEKDSLDRSFSSKMFSSEPISTPSNASQNNTSKAKNLKKAL